MRATELRAHAAGGFGAWPDVQSATFIFFYVIEGQVSFQLDVGSQVHLGRREAAHLSFLRHVEAVRYSADLQEAEVRAPGSAAATELVPLLPDQNSGEAGDWDAMIVRTRPELFLQAEGPRAF